MLRRLPSREMDEIMVDSRPELGEVKTVAYDVRESARRMGAEPTAGKFNAIGGVRDGLIFPMPPEVPDMPDLSDPAGNAPLAECPCPSYEPGRGAFPEGRAP